MIAGELKATDNLRSLFTFFAKELEALGYDQHRFKLDAMPEEEALGTRWFVLTEGGKVAAALGLWPTNPEVSYVVPYLVVAGDHADKVKMLDALVLWGSNRLASERVKLLYTSAAPGPTHPRALTAWAVVHSGLKRGDPLTLDDGVLKGTPTNLMVAILERRPEWRLSLSSMT